MPTGSTRACAPAGAAIAATASPSAIRLISQFLLRMVRIWGRHCHTCRKAGLKYCRNGGSGCRDGHSSPARPALDLSFLTLSCPRLIPRDGLFAGETGRIGESPFWGSQTGGCPLTPSDPFLAPDLACFLGKWARATILFGVSQTRECVFLLPRKGRTATTGEWVANPSAARVRRLSDLSFCPLLTPAPAFTPPSLAERSEERLLPLLGDVHAACDFKQTFVDVVPCLSRQGQSIPDLTLSHGFRCSGLSSRFTRLWERLPFAVAVAEISVLVGHRWR
jgi:hypothetical protein